MANPHSASTGSLLLGSVEVSGLRFEDVDEDALFVWRGRKVAVAIDLGHPAGVRLEGLK